MIRESLPRPEDFSGFLTGVIREHGLNAPRLEKLQRYARGRHDIAARQREPGMPNIRLSFAFGRYISQVSAGYLLGEPVRYTGGGSKAASSAFTALMKAAGADACDSELAMQQSVYGRGVCLCYRGEGDVMRLTALDPRGAFVVYDDTVERAPLMGVLVSAGGDGRRGTVSVYTREHCHVWPLQRGGAVKGPPVTRPHPFNRVPMVEVLNDADAQGDFEDLLPLMDAYDLLASDRFNDRAQFADALLVLTGVMGITAGNSDDVYSLDGNRLRMHRTLTLPDHEATAKWLVKNPVEQDIDVLRRALSSDIHKFSMTPDFSDERFGGTTSGVSIRYKLFCLEQKTRLKARRFETGLRERARVAAGWMRAQGLPHLDPERLHIAMKRGENPFPRADNSVPNPPATQQPLEEDT